MNILYICHTIYHLLISMAKLDESARNSVCLVDTILEVDEIHARLAKTGIFDSITILRADNFVNNDGYSEEFVRTYGDFFRTFDKVNIFNDNTYIGFFLHRQKIEYHLIEDGYNYYQYYSLDQIKADYDWMKKEFPKMDFPLTKGYGEFCVSVESNDISHLPKDERYSKFIEIPRKDLFESLTERKKSAIMQTFPLKIPKSNKKSLLILSQPLAKDGLMKSEREQVEFYSKIIKENRWRYNIFFKPHPRDDVELPRFLGVTFVEKTTPIEVLQMISDFEFDKGITHSSTALEFLPNVKEKITLVDLKAKK